MQKIKSQKEKRQRDKKIKRQIDKKIKDRHYEETGIRKVKKRDKQKEKI